MTTVTDPFLRGRDIVHQKECDDCRGTGELEVPMCAHRSCDCSARVVSCGCEDGVVEDLECDCDACSALFEQMEVRDAR